jgi:preprotein translocase subunit YajC
VMIRPQQRRMRQHQALISSLEAGDEVLTASGLYGTIASIDDDMVGLEVAPGVSVRVLRSSIGQRLAPASEEASDEAGAPLDRTPDDEV